MNNAQLQQNINKIKSKLSLLEAELVELTKPKIFPQPGEKYFYQTIQGVILDSIANADCFYINVYSTQFEAERARDIAFARQKVKFAIECANSGWLPDWSDEIQAKYTIEYNTGNKELLIEPYFRTKNHPDWMYCRTKEIATEIIYKHKEDLLLIFSE